MEFLEPAAGRTDIRQVLLGPVADSSERGGDAAPEIGQGVLDLGRPHLGVDLAMDEPVPAKYPDRRIMTAEQVVRFGSDRAPIEGTQVHLARYVAGDWVLNRTRSGVVFSSDDDITGGEPNVLVTALCVGSLILLVVAPTRPGYVPDANRLAQADAPFTLTIFPTNREATTWPPAVAVPSEKLVQLVDVNSCVLRPDWLGKFRLPNNYSTVKGLFPELGQNVCSKLCHTPRS